MQDCYDLARCRAQMDSSWPRNLDSSRMLLAAAEEADHCSSATEQVAEQMMTNGSSDMAAIA